MSPINPVVAKRLEKIKKWLGEAEGENLWAVLTCLRGPDSPSEKGGSMSGENAALYQARRKRKFNTVEIIRDRSGLYGGGARRHPDDAVTLPPQAEWDHFDKHVALAAKVLGLGVKEGK